MEMSVETVASTVNGIVDFSLTTIICIQSGIDLSEVYAKSMESKIRESELVLTFGLSKIFHFMAFLLAKAEILSKCNKNERCAPLFDSCK